MVGMKLKAYRKDFFMEIKHTYSRFLSIMCIVALGVAFYSGIRSAGPDMKISADKMYDECKMYDLKIYSLQGLTNEDVEKIESIKGIEKAEGAYSADVVDISGTQERIVKVSSMTDVVNKMHLVKGEYPKNSKECMVDETYFKNAGYEIGDTITVKSGKQDMSIEYMLKEVSYEIVGVYNNPLFLKVEHGDTDIGNGKIDGFVTIISEDFTFPAFTEINVLAEDVLDYMCYDDEYADKIEEISKTIKSADEKYIVTDRRVMQSYYEFEMDGDRIDRVGDIIPIIFYIVAALVSLTTMTRMVDEQRTLIGTYKALGYGKTIIAMKYILYAFLATVFGSVIGALIGSFVLPVVIINGYKLLYANVYLIETPINIMHCLVSVGISMLCVIGATVVSCYRSLSASAAELMRPVAPKNGKNILLEKIPFIWKRMSFTWKSVFRNISRYKKRIFMTIFGICGCMSLLLVGFGIKDSIGTIVVSQYEDLHKYDLYAKYGKAYNSEEIKVINDYYDSKEEINSYINMYSATSQISNGKKNISGYIYAIDDVEKFKDFIIFGTGEKIPELSKDGVIITKKLSVLLNLKVGDEIELKGANGEEGPKVKITGIAKNYIFHYVYMSKECYENIYGADYLYNQSLIKQNSNKDLSEELLKNEYIVSVSTSKSLRENFENMLEGLDVIILVIIISAGGLAFVVLYNLNNINICERVRELATLKVLGFYDMDVSAYIFRENVILTMVGVITGCLGGNLLHEFVMDTIEVDMVMFGRNIEIPSYFYATLITLTFAVLINLTMHFKLKKIDMTTSLKSVD